MSEHAEQRVSADETVLIYADSLKELDEAQQAYIAEPDEETFKRFWVARERYQALTREIVRMMSVQDATLAYRERSA